MTSEEQGEYLRALARRTGDPSVARLVTPQAARQALKQAEQSHRFRHELTRFQTVAVAIAQTAQHAMRSARQDVRERAEAARLSERIQRAAEGARRQEASHAALQGAGSGLSGALHGSGAGERG